MKFQFENKRFPEVKQLPTIPIPTEVVTLDLPAPATREDRVRIRDAKASVEGLHRKISELADQNEELRDCAAAGGSKTKRMRMMESRTAVLLPQLQPVESPAPLKKKEVHERRRYIPFEDRIEMELKKFRKPFKDINFESRIKRIDHICSQIIAACIDKDEEEKEYYIANEEFANEIMNIVNMIQSRLAIKLKYNLSLIDKPDICELIDDDKQCINSYGSWGLTENFRIAYQVLGEATSRGYDRIRKNFMKIMPVIQLPSIYMLNKALPTGAVGCVFQLEVDEEEKQKEKDDLIYGTKRLDVKADDKNDLKNLIMLTHDRKKVVGAKLDGSFDDYVEPMAHKHEMEGQRITDGSDNILLNLFDGAEAIKSKDNLSSVISFLSQIFTANQIEEKSTKAGSSSNILTLLQVIGKETIDMLKIVGKKYLGCRK
jgi:hypothetical protein